MSFYHVYADESRQTNSRHMLFGALFVPRGPEEDRFCSAIRTFRNDENMHAELKWGKVSRSKLDAYCRLVDIFFAHGTAKFYCLVVDTHKIDYRAYQNDREASFYAFYNFALSRNMEASHRYLVMTDERNNKGLYRLSDLKDEINAFWRNKGAEEDIVRNVEARDSKSVDQLQVVDVLLGAVGYAFEEYDTSEPRVALVKHIADHLSATNLKSNTNESACFSISRFQFTG